MSKKIPRLDLPLNCFGDPAHWPKLLYDDGRWANEKAIRKTGFHIPAHLSLKVWTLLEDWARAELASQGKWEVRR